MEKHGRNINYDIQIDKLYKKSNSGSSNQIMNINIEKEKEKLLEVHAKTRQAHLELDAELMVSTFADHVFRVASGAVSQSSKDDFRKNYKEYFSSSTYHEMDDLEPPIIRISQDASMAWMIVRTQVRFTYQDETGKEAEQAFIYAGIVTYEKQDGEWLRTANVATVE